MIVTLGVKSALIVFSLAPDLPLLTHALTPFTEFFLFRHPRCSYAVAAITTAAAMAAVARPMVVEAAPEDAEADA